MTDTRTDKPDTTDPAHPLADFWSRVTAVIVTHHSAAVVAACARSVLPARQVIVVDNASDDDTIKIVKENVPSAKIIMNSVGRGYGNACNQALEHVETEFALLINPDSTIDSDSVKALIHAADTYPDSGLLAPLLLDTDGTPRPGYDNNVIIRRLQNLPKRSEPILPAGPVCSGFIIGAVVLVRMKAIREIDGFDRHIFLYGEDDDLCMRLQSAGWSSILIPEAIAHHIGGGSSPRTLQRCWEEDFHRTWSGRYMSKKYFKKRNFPEEGILCIFYAFKAIFYSLTLNKNRALRDWARFSGMAAWILGLPVVPKISLKKE